jgi:hypothetical protein
VVVKLDIQKFRQGMYWTNRYLLDLADPSSVSSTIVVAIASAEQNFHATSVTIISARASDMVEGTDNFFVFPLNLVGGINDGGEPLPGFITMRADFGVGQGRPLRKYWRTYVGEGQTTGGVWSPAYVSAVQTQVDYLVSSMSIICDPQGNNILNGVAKNQLQMRQLRRGTRKPTQPVIPVS